LDGILGQAESCMVEREKGLKGGVRRERQRERNPNNGMHPTGNSANVMRETRMLLSMLPGG